MGAAPARRTFPLMMRGAKREPVKGAIAWEVAELGWRQAMHNHGQTLERLAERGGLSPFEMACALAGSGLFDGIKPSQEQAMIMLAGAAHALDRLREIKPKD
jgi:hypothetical protein